MIRGVMRWTKVLAAIAVLLIAAGITGAVLVTQYDYNKLKPTIAKMAQEATGRALTINGDLNLAVSLSPTLTVSDVTFAGAAWGTKKEMMRLNQLAAKVDLMALLQGRVDIDYLVLDGLALVFETDGKGRANWEFETPDAATTAAAPDTGDDLQLVPSARDVRLQNVDVTYIDGATGKRVQLLLQRADFKADSFTSPMHATLAAAYQGVNLEALVDLGSLSHLVGSSGAAFPVNMVVSGPGLSVSIDGAVEQPQAGLNVDALMVVSVSDGTTLTKLAGADFAHLGGLKLTTKIQGGGSQYSFNAIDVGVGESDLGGSVTVNLAAKRPRVTGKLASKILDLDKILNIGTPTSDSTPEPTPQLFSADPLALEGLKAVDVDLGVSAARIKVANLDVDALKAQVKLTKGKAVLEPLSLGLGGGNMAGSVRFDGGTKTPTLKVASKLKAVDVGRLLEAFGQGDLVTLPVNGQINLSSTGVSVQKLMAHMNGAARLSGRNGRINDVSITNLTSGLGNVLPWAKQKNASLISCLVADWPVKNGVATAKTVLMDTPGFSVAVTGNVDLGGERLHLTVVPQAKSASLASFAVPVRVKGPLGAPYVDVNPADALVGTVGNVFKAPAKLLGDILGGLNDNGAPDQKSDPCFAALSGGKTTPAQPSGQPAPTSPPPPQGKTLGTLIPVDELGKSLKSLFGQ